MLMLKPEKALFIPIGIFMLGFETFEFIPDSGIFEKLVKPGIAPRLRLLFMLFALLLLLSFEILLLFVFMFILLLVIILLGLMNGSNEFVDGTPILFKLLLLILLLLILLLGLFGI